MPRCRRRCCSGRWRSRRAARSTPSPWTASARPTTACSRWRRAPTAWPWTRSCTPRSQAAFYEVSKALAIGIVRGGEGATKLITISVTHARTARRRHAGGEDHRQLAAGEDGGARRRPELGAHRGRRRPLGRALRRRPRHGARRRHAAVRTGPAARRRRAARRPRTSRAPRSASTWTWARAATRRPRCGRAISAPSTSASTANTGRNAVAAWIPEPGA